MRRVFITLLLAISLVFSAGLGAVSYAAPADTNPIIPICNAGNNSGTNGAQTQICNNVNDQNAVDNPIIRIISAATKVVAFIAGAMAIIFIVLAALRFVTAGGDTGNMAQARQALIYALVGIAITVLAQVIVVFVLEKL